MKKLFLTFITLISGLMAGGDIAPIETPITDPVVNTGDALSITSIIILMTLTVVIGLFFVKKESEVK